MSSSDGAQYDPGPGGGAALDRASRGLAQKIKDWTDARIAAALASRSGLTSLKINGAQIGLRQHLDVQMTGATGEDHPELDLARVLLPGGWVEIATYTVPAGSGEGSINFSALPQTYKTLVAVGDTLFLGTPNAFAVVPVKCVVNTWTGYDYGEGRHGLTTSGTHVTTDVAANPVGWTVCEIPGPGATGDKSAYGGHFVLWLPGYAVTPTASKSMTCHSTGNTNGRHGMHYTGVWAQGTIDPATPVTPGISQLTFYTDPATSPGNPHDTITAQNVFAPGARITIYGLT